MDINVHKRPYFMDIYPHIRWWVQIVCIGSVHVSLPKLESTKNWTQKKNAHPTNASSTM